MSRVVYGATCSWWDAIDKAGRTAGGLLGCPICHGPLYEVGVGEWWAGVDRKVAVDDPLYREFIEWLRGRCYCAAAGPDFFARARAVFDVERAEHAARQAEMERQSFDTGKPGLSPYKTIEMGAARQLTSHLVESSAIHSKSRGWIPSVIVTLDHVPLFGKGKAEQLKIALELDTAQEFIDILITGLERAIADADYGLREA